MVLRPRFAALCLAAAIGLAGPAAAAPAMPSGLRAPVDVAAATGHLRRLPGIGRSLRLSGETDRLVVPVYLTTAEAAAQPRLRLTLLAAVSVMPEASRLSVFVDDRPVGGLPIAASGAPRTVEFALPAGSLHAGWNAVRLEAQQRHRVDCTTASTYELWTEIDPARSGLVFADGFAPARATLADVAAVAPDEQGRVALRLVMPQDPEPTRLARALRAAEAVALAGGLVDPIVSVVRAPEKTPGIDLLIGAAARQLADPALRRAATGAAVVDDADPARLSVLVPDDAAELDRFVGEATAAVVRPAEGLDAGRRARAALGGLPITGDETRTFSDFGVASTEFSGRLFRTALDMRLPADLYAADYAKVVLRLTGGQAPGLDKASRLTVRVNGRQIAGTPLGAERGEIFTDRRIKIPLSAFRPGHNRVEIEASLIHADDRICDAAGQIDAAERFLLVDRSEIVFPAFARIARLPDLAATAAGVLAELDPAQRPTLAVPHPDSATLSAVATLLTRTAVAAGRIDVPRIMFRNPGSETGSALVVGAFPDLPATVAGTVGIESGAVRDAWSRRPAATAVGEAPLAADRLGRRVAALRAGDLDPIATGTTPMPRLAEPAESGDVVDRWRRSIESPWSPSALARAGARRVEDFVAPLFGTTSARPAVVPHPSTGVVLAQAVTSSGGVWTMLTAPTSAVLFEGTTTLTQSARWNALAGGVATWDRSAETLETAAAAGRSFYATAPLGPTGMRLVAAGWASDNPIVFVFAALALTLLLGWATARLVPHLGVRS